MEDGGLADELRDDQRQEAQHRQPPVPPLSARRERPKAARVRRLAVHDGHQPGVCEELHGAHEVDEPSGRDGQPGGLLGDEPQTMPSMARRQLMASGAAPSNANTLRNNPSPVSGRRSTSGSGVAHGLVETGRAWRRSSSAAPTPWSPCSLNLGLRDLLLRALVVSLNSFSASHLTRPANVANRWRAHPARILIRIRIQELPAG